ncbi:hypothetical protein [Bacillus wiedmannii]|uniref:hypothetical protein n=1 Tax=Bacillus wiedmannii TaxID=1890302 RepID=UPI002E1BFA2C|nr:hypothetical protein [Bacillus wiedmannii]
MDTIETMRIEGDLNPTRYCERKAEYEEKIANLHEMKQRIEYLLQNWQFLDGEGLTDEEVNRSLHFIIERIEWTYAKGDEQPTVKIKYK